MLFMVSPHSGGGSGLKLAYGTTYMVRTRRLPSLRWGERIETSASPDEVRILKEVSPHSGGGSGLKPGK